MRIYSAYTPAYRQFTPVLGGPDYAGHIVNFTESTMDILYICATLALLAAAWRLAAACARLGGPQ